MKKFVFFLTAFFIATSIIFPQSDTLFTKLDEIVVTANRVKTKAYELANSVTVITGRQLGLMKPTSLTNALRDVPGISIAQQGGPGKMSSLFMRGANSNQTLVMIDGVILNDPSSPNGGFDFSTLQVSDIARIEIVRGPQSTLYGSDAMAGVINIITKKGKGKPKFSIHTEGGTHNSYLGSVSARGSIDFFNYSMNFSRNQSKGISAISKSFGNKEKDGFSNNSFNSQFNLKFSKNVNFNFLYQYVLAKTALDRPYKTGDDPNYTYNTEEQLFHGQMNFSFFNGKWNQNIYASTMKKISHSLNLPDKNDPSSSKSYYNGERIKFGWQNNLSFLKNNLVTFGIEIGKEKTYSNYFSKSAWGSYTQSLSPQSFKTTGTYLQDKMNFKNSLFTTIGVRYDHNSQFGGVITYRIAPAYLFPGINTKIKATYGTGFQSPSLFDLFDPTYGNINLKPEKSKGFDAGIEQYLFNNHFSFSVTYFNTEYSNLIGFDKNFKAINIDKAVTKGIEAEVSVMRFKKINISGSYTYTEALNKSENPIDKDKQLLRRPKNKFAVNLNYVPLKKLNLNLNFLLVGKRYDKDFSTYPVRRVVLKSYSLTNFTLTYNLYKYFQIYGKINNVFNTQYEEVLYYGTLGRTFYMGMNLHF